MDEMDGYGLPFIGAEIGLNENDKGKTFTL